MNKKLTWSLLAVASLSAAFFWFYASDRSIAVPTGSVGLPSETTESPVRIAAGPNPLDPKLGGNGSRPADSPINFDAISKISQIQESAERSGTSPGQALEYLRTAAAYCETRGLYATHPTKRQLSGNVSPPERKAEAYHKAFAAKFCDTKTESFGDITGRLASLSSGDDVLQASYLINLEGDEVGAVGNPIASGLILKSESPDAISRAAEFLLDQQHEDLPQTRKLPFPASIQGQSRRDVQMLAIKMLACEMRGGCGPDGFYSVLGCGSNCYPGVSMAEVWRNENSPEAIRYARSLASALHTDRKVAATRN